MAQKIIVDQKDARDAVQAVLDLLADKDWVDVVDETGLPKSRVQEIMSIYQKLLSKYG